MFFLLLADQAERVRFCALSQLGPPCKRTCGDRHRAPGWADLRNGGPRASLTLAFDVSVDKCPFALADLAIPTSGGAGAGCITVTMPYSSPGNFLRLV